VKNIYYYYDYEDAMRCLKCSYEWVTRKVTPKECPRCKSRLDRMNTKNIKPLGIFPQTLEEFNRDLRENGEEEYTMEEYLEAKKIRKEIEILS